MRAVLQVMPAKLYCQWKQDCSRTPEDGALHIWSRAFSLRSREGSDDDFAWGLHERWARASVLGSKRSSTLEVSCLSLEEWLSPQVPCPVAEVYTMQPNKPDYKKMIREKAFSWLRFWKVLRVHVQMWKWRVATTIIPHLKKLLLLLWQHIRA